MKTHLKIEVLSKEKELLFTHDYVCLVGLRDSIHGLSITPIYLKYIYKTGLSESQQIDFITRWSRMWFFGEYLNNPQQIVKDKGLTFDMRTTNGFRFYCVMSVLRWMEEVEYEVKNLLKLPAQQDKQENGLQLYKWIMSNPELRSGHSFFNSPECHNIQKFNSLLEEPNQPLLKDGYYFFPKGTSYYMYFTSENCI